MSNKKNKNQAGKGDGNRVSDHKSFRDNHDYIRWPKKCKTCDGDGLVSGGYDAEDIMDCPDCGGTGEAH